MDSKVQLRLVELYKQSNHAGKVCTHYGISRFTLRKWYKRYELLGEKGLYDISSIPKAFPLQKRSETNEKLIINLRKERNLGARRIQSELKRLYGISFSTATIHKVLKKYAVAPLHLKRHYRKQLKRYSCKVPGERVQMDVCKITKHLYQYTAIDDCTRYKVLALYKRRTAENTLDFLDQVMDRMPFPIQRIQIDRGQEFFAYVVQEYLQKKNIKFRPIKPLSPHLNGKVERTQRTDLDEFYSSTDLKDQEIQSELMIWEEYYNKHRSHSSLHGIAPWEKYKELEHTIPSIEKVHKSYDSSKETFAIQNYKYDQGFKAAIKNKIY
ncbi:IS481 family transposase [Candidatus Tisiphia endosymbiont of Nedyus quadrimaculatus]|uniref:IS481 family transposase n=1 Tax=Candidatus Tisiphia endosymbiont of Nedyus quadrimaculatus TaxID=3139332 RepID=UPI00345EFDC6